MATQQDIKRRITSVNNTRKITKAMELVAGSRLRRAQARIEALRPYADRMQQLMVDVASRHRRAERSAAAGPPRGSKRRRDRDHRRPRLGRRIQRQRGAALARDRPRASVPQGREVVGWCRPPRRLDAALPPPGDRGRLHRHDRPPAVRQRPGDRHARGRAVRGRRGRPGGDGLQPLPLGADPAAGRGRAAAGARGGDRGREAVRSRAPTSEEPDGREILAELLPDLPRDHDLPRAAGVDRVRARRPHDRDAKRVRQRRRADRRPHLEDEPRPPGRDHPGDPRGRCGCGRPRL